MTKPEIFMWHKTGNNYVALTKSSH